MASEQNTISDTIDNAVTKVTRVTIQTMAATAANRPQTTVEPKIGGPAMKQPAFIWETEEKYSELKTFN